MGINERSLFDVELVKQIDNDLYVDSLIIAENTGNQHKAVIQLVRKYSKSISNFGTLEFKIQSFQTNGGKQKREVAYLNENQSILLMTLLRNSEEVIIFKERLVKAFSIMKEKLSNQNHQIPQNYSQALLLASKQAEQIEQQQEQLKLNAPKVEFYDMAIKSNDLLLMRDVAKLIDKKGLGQDKLFKFLRIRNVLQDKKWNKNMHNAPYQEYIDRGYFKVCESAFNKGSKAGIQLTTKVTQKGLAWINKQVNIYYEILKDRVEGKE